MMTYELDDTEKEALLGAVIDRVRADLNDEKQLTQMAKGPYSNDGPLSKMNPRPGEKVQKSWCPDCREWHEGSVLGGPVGDPHR